MTCPQSEGGFHILDFGLKLYTAFIIMKAVQRYSPVHTNAPSSVGQSICSIFTVAWMRRVTLSLNCASVKGGDVRESEGEMQRAAAVSSV